jgi:hypothetical protein
MSGKCTATNGKQSMIGDGNAKKFYKKLNDKRSKIFTEPTPITIGSAAFLRV